MTVYVIESKRSGLYVKEIQDGSLLMTSNQTQALKYFYPNVAKTEMYKNEISTEHYKVRRVGK